MHAIGAGGLGFDSRAGQIDTVSPTARHRCDVSSELCSPGAKSRRWAPPLYGAPYVKLRNIIKFCIIFSLNYVQYHISLQFMYIAAICVKLLQFMYIAAICVNCCNLRTLQKNFKSAINCHGDMLTKTVSVALSLFP